jgi:hypothetical protein
MAKNGNGEGSIDIRAKEERQEDRLPRGLLGSHRRRPQAALPAGQDPC